MTTPSETGLAMKVANLEKLIANATSMGEAYNPNRADLKLPALKALHALAKEALSAISSIEPEHKKAVSARETAFKPFAKRVTRISNALKASGTTPEFDKQCMALIRKLQGKRATPKLTDEELKEAEAEGKEPKQISSAQTSFDSKVENLEKTIKMLASAPEYAPNEADLKIEALTAYHETLVAANTNVINTWVPLNKARARRDEILYTELTGLVDISVDVKSYIKSISSASSPEYKAVSGLKFTNPN